MRMTSSQGTPKWSVMIPTFNCAQFLEQTLRSVLDQDPGEAEMQIEVVDDCSFLDDPESVVNRVGKGRVGFFRNKANLGAAANFNVCIERAKGELLHILHGDDYVLDGFYIRMLECFEETEELSVAFSRCLVIDEAGTLRSVSPRIVEYEIPTNDPSGVFYSNPIRTPGVVIRRKWLEEVGGFDETFSHVADWDMWFRLITLGNGQFINWPLAVYRQFEGSDTGSQVRSANNLKEHYRIGMEKFSGHYLFDRAVFHKTIRRLADQQASALRAKGDVDALDRTLDFMRTNKLELRWRERLGRLFKKIGSRISS